MNVGSVPYNLLARPSVWVIALNALCLIAFIGSPWAAEYPVAGLSILAFVVVQIFCPACRPNFAAPICPANIAQGFFWVQLVLVSLLIGFCGISLGTLPTLPSSDSIDMAICLRILGYVSFSVVYQCLARPTVDSDDEPHADGPTEVAIDTRRYFLMTVIFAGIGLVGCVLFYRGIDGYLEYLSSPVFHFEREQEDATLAGAAGNLLRHFLGFAIVLAWSWWITSANRPRSLAGVIAGTIVAAGILLCVNFTYNRATTLGPVLALVAAYSVHVRRVSVKLVAAATVIVMAGALIFGTYRSSNLEVSDLSTADLGAAWEDQHMVDFVQIYASGPQLTAHLIDHVEHTGQSYLGKTLLPSILYPIPVLGKPYRESSGVLVFNRSIYGSDDVNDQIIAYDSELYLNFHLPGVVIGYALLGWVLAVFQSRFLAAPTPVETYIWIMLALWTVFPGSFAVTSQWYVYSFWPIYVYAFVRGLCVQATPAPATEFAPSGGA